MIALKASSAEPSPPRRATVILVALLVVAGASRLMLWARPLGFLTGDDVEILSAGFASATGLVYQPWAIRNLVLPRLVVAPAVGLGTLLGIGDHAMLIRLGEAPFFVLSLLNIVLVYRLARLVVRPGTERLVPLLAAGIYAFHWLPAVYSVTAYPRTASTTCVLLAALLLLGEEQDLGRGAGAGALVAVAFAVRYSEAIFLLPLALLGIFVGLDRRASLRRALGIAVGFCSGTLLSVGLVDWWTWGRPFVSLVEFARYTLVEGRASSLVVAQSPVWYLKRAGFWLVPPLIPFLFFKARGLSLGLWGLFALPVLTLSVIHHKEMRYLQAVIPFLAILAAVGAAHWLRRGRGWRVAASFLLALGLALSVHTAWRVHEHGSQSAVAAARQLAGQGCVRQLVVTQAWAYGLGLILGNGVAITEFDRPPTPEELRSALPGADVVAMYADDLARQPELAAELAGGDFRRGRTIAVGESRPVVLFWNRRGSCSANDRPAARRLSSRRATVSIRSGAQGAVTVADTRCRGAVSSPFHMPHKAISLFAPGFDI